MKLINLELTRFNYTTPWSVERAIAEFYLKAGIKCFFKSNSAIARLTLRVHKFSNY